MKKFLRLSALVMILLTGCASQKQELNIAEEDLPYGATMRSNKTSYTVPMTYDRRFVNESQVKAVADYLGAVQNNDPDLFASAALPLYMNYQIQEVYHYEDTANLVDVLHSGIASQTGEDFQFDMILITDYSQANNGGLKAMTDLLSNLDSQFSDSVQGAWEFTLEWELSYDNGQKNGMTEDQHLYLFQIEDQYYCCM